MRFHYDIDLDAVDGDLHYTITRDPDLGILAQDALHLQHDVTTASGHGRPPSICGTRLSDGQARWPASGADRRRLADAPVPPCVTVCR